MDMIFEQGNQDQPKGHAILYYRSGGSVLATYVVVLPLQVDFAKYIPPVLAAQVKDTGLEEFSAFAIPPMPEEVQSYEFLEDLARRRGDDLVFGGEVRDNDFLEAAQRVNDAVQAYAQLYQQVNGVAQGGGTLESAPSDLSVDEVMFSLTSEKDKLRDLSKLVGKLQFAMEGKDSRLIRETEGEIGSLARYLPENYHVTRIIESARRSVEQGSRLTQLYLERCYKLADEDYLGLQEVEQAIRDLQDAAG